ncbi:TrbI/VirB10 family protein [Enterobacter asburiae]|uniref:TrbI/VirB10 family protein n=1 Tax=Enterobacter asburiae TaxID=61645 RepID=UPI003F54D07C
MAKDKLKVNPSDAYLGGRISKKMVMIAGTIGALVLMVIVTVLAGKGQHNNAAPEDTTPDKVSADNTERDALLNKAPTTPGVPAAATAPQPGQTTGSKAAPAAASGDDRTQDDNMLIQAQQRETLRVRQLKEQQFEVALAAPTMIKVDLTDENQDKSRDKPKGNIGNDLQLPPTSMTSTDRPPDPNGQDEKEAFSGKVHSNTYLTQGREKPLGQWELKVGTLIPGVLISGLNSDLPGQVIATVSQNVYDSITHSQILIPQGAQLYGLYDSRIAYGQDRVLMAWTRINYPDGTTIELDGMGGVDTQGYAGFADQVDHHYWKIFGNALILGMISGTVQASVSDGKSDSNNNSRGQDVSNGVTQQFATTGSTLIQKNLDVQPTITIRNGYKFNIMLNKDIVLPPWQPAE